MKNYSEDIEEIVEYYSSQISQNKMNFFLFNKRLLYRTKNYFSQL